MLLFTLEGTIFIYLIDTFSSFSFYQRKSHKNRLCLRAKVNKASSHTHLHLYCREKSSPPNPPILKWLQNNRIPFGAPHSSKYTSFYASTHSSTSFYHWHSPSGRVRSELWPFLPIVTWTTLTGEEVGSTRNWREKMNLSATPCNTPPDWQRPPSTAMRAWPRNIRLSREVLIFFPVEV